MIAMVAMILLSTFTAEVSNDALSMEEWLNVVVLVVVSPPPKAGRGKADIVTHLLLCLLGPILHIDALRDSDVGEWLLSL